MSGPSLQPPRAETRHSAGRRRPARTAVPAYKVNAWSRCAAASAVRTLQLSESCRPHLFEVLAGMIARAGQRGGSDEQESLRPRYRAVRLERPRRDELLDLRMTGGGLEVLAHGQEIDARGAHVIHDLMDFEPLLAETDHQPRLGENVRCLALHALQQPQRRIIASPGTD